MGLTLVAGNWFYGWTYTRSGSLSVCHWITDVLFMRPPQRLTWWQRFVRLLHGRSAGGPGSNRRWKLKHGL